MFQEFLYTLRAYGLPVSTTEWLAFQKALAGDLAAANMERFYNLSRALLVKNETIYDRFDQAFAEHFRGALPRPELKADMMRWLAKDVLKQFFTEAELVALESMPLEELMELFEKRLQEQAEEHNGGSKWVGTKGKSPFGHSGQMDAPPGVRVGGMGGLKRAMKVASKRRFRNLRTDIQFNVRHMTVALRKLRKLSREGQFEELDLDETIRKTCDNAGDIDLVFRPSRKNSLKLLLLSDVGGSMEPFRRLCERLFTAAHKTHHFKRFRSFYFHNCIYNEVYTDMARRKGLAFSQLINNSSREECVIIIGDAAMAPSELFMPGGNIEYWSPDDPAGQEFLLRLKDKLPRAVWLNPLPQRAWRHPTVAAIEAIFPMFEMTLDGLDLAIAHLRRQGVRA
jgi:uncharacterized protein